MRNECNDCGLGHAHGQGTTVNTTIPADLIPGVLTRGLPVR